MAFRLVDPGTGKRTLHAGEPTQKMLDSGWTVLDALCDPWGGKHGDAEKLAEADARLEKKLADPKRNGWKQVDAIPQRFA